MQHYQLPQEKVKHFVVVIGTIFLLTINMCDRGRTITHLQIPRFHTQVWYNYNDVTMGSMASQITSLTIVYSAVNSDADQRKHQSSTSLAFVPGIHRGPLNSPHKWPVRRKMFPFVDAIMIHGSNDCVLSGVNSSIIVANRSAYNVSFRFN